MKKIDVEDQKLYDCPRGLTCDTCAAAEKLEDTNQAYYCKDYKRLISYWRQAKKIYEKNKPNKSCPHCYEAAMQGFRYCPHCRRGC